jgi:predicted alpha/beta superfamily hydrolase
MSVALPGPRRSTLMARSLLPIPLFLLLSAALLLLDCGGQGLAETQADLTATTTVRVHYPAGSHTVALRGDAAKLTWARGVPLAAAGGDTWVFTTRALARNTRLDFKPLLDDQTWSKGPNYAVSAGATVDVWPRFTHDQGTVTRIDQWWSNGLANTRPIWVYTPPSYAEQPAERFPVVYMHDGQNLFEAAWSFGGVTWQVAPALDAGAADGTIREAIVIGIGNTANRMWEYTASSDPDYSGGGARDYLTFVAVELKGQIDRLYRTSPGRLDTGVVGSSLGGLASAYAGLWRADTFGLVGALSPSTWWNNEELVSMVAAAGSNPMQPARVYVDSGDSGPSSDDVTQTAALAAGYRKLPGVQVQYVVGHGDTHTESSWARRLPGALRFLLGARQAQ